MIDTQTHSKVVLYMPVVHQGYLTFLDEFLKEPVYVLASEITHQFKPLRKDIRSLEPSKVVAILQALKIGSPVVEADSQILTELNLPQNKIVMPDEEPMRTIAEQYLGKAQVEFKSVFLRWDRTKSLEEHSLDQHQKVSTDFADQKLMQQAEVEAEKSTDQWRQVGALAVKEGQVLFQDHNRHLPDDYQPAYAGDMRGNFSKGIEIDKTTAQHAEAGIVAAAAKAGTSLVGVDLYVTTFPCPVCAKLISETGIKRLFFRSGYAVADGQRILEAAGVELVRVELW